LRDNISTPHKNPCNYVGWTHTLNAWYKRKLIIPVLNTYSDLMQGPVLTEWREMKANAVFGKLCEKVCREYPFQRVTAVTFIFNCFLCWPLGSVEVFHLLTLVVAVKMLVFKGDSADMCTGKFPRTVKRAQTVSEDPHRRERKC
jgi:hypothetical protein